MRSRVDRRAVAGAVAAFLAVWAIVIIAGIVRIDRQMPEVRQALSGGAADLTTEDLDEAIAGLEEVRGILDGPAFKATAIVPVARNNVAAVRAVVDGLLPAVRTATEVARLIDEESEELFTDGEAQLETFGALEPALAAQERAITDLRDEAVASLDPLLLPPIHKDIAEVAREAHRIASTIGRLETAARLAPDMLGAERPRRYAVLLLNNAEQRGAGGIASAIGSVTFSNGRLNVGRFRHYQDLRDPFPYRKVPAPPDLERRFGRYWSDTTLWVNSTASPDVPEVADVVAELLRLTTGTRVSGVILVDPHGLAALLDPDDDIDTDLPEVDITARELPDFVHSRAYELYTSAPERRAALLALAPAVLEEARTELNLAAMKRLGEAAGGGHVRFVSLDPEEAEFLTEVGLSGELTTDATDSVLVTMQNLGGDKLDYWVEREQQHGCTIAPQRARCLGTVTLTNEVPEEVPRYVTNDDATGEYEGYIEVYLDDDASVTSFGIDGTPVDAAVEREDGRQALGTDVTIPRGGSITVGYSYELPLEETYSLSLTPAPLAEPAAIEVGLRVPSDWNVITPDGDPTGSYSDRLTFDRPIELRAHPIERDGLSGLWNRVVRFWEEPVF